ncbi:unnamed protein product [Rangifer tarandus platyrhynchus]|uniref:Uncharacterized protein n=2 Tax=Rangifer tarandus platyrhynchus TaxID=3082113 RepID=A0ACB0F8U9_RANTA|nr:unnamed protein product [Rangifer tarandus platyrhynchus]CAI9709288.1 unnamed protein product [Rangifer tarandus platyrhynchus]
MALVGHHVGGFLRVRHSSRPEPICVRPQTPLLPYGFRKDHKRCGIYAKEHFHREIQRKNIRRGCSVVWSR